MFVLVELSDNIRILPHLFDEEVAAVTAEINKKYANKVLHNVGLVVCLFDIRSISDGLLFPADGSSHVKAVFRVVVFRPFIGEVLIGTIRASDPDGIYVSLGFFEDIHIPPSCLPNPSHFDESQECWYWLYNDIQMWMDNDKQIRFRVFSLEFGHKDSPKSAATSVSSSALGDVKVPPMKITGFLDEVGLGLLEWWPKEEESATDDQAELESTGGANATELTADGEQQR